MMRINRRSLFGLLAITPVLGRLTGQNWTPPAPKPLPARHILYADGIHCDAGAVEAMCRGEIVDVKGPATWFSGSKPYSIVDANLYFGRPVTLGNIHLKQCLVTLRYGAQIYTPEPETVSFPGTFILRGMPPLPWCFRNAPAT